MITFLIHASHMSGHLSTVWTIINLGINELYLRILSHNVIRTNRKRTRITKDRMKNSKLEDYKEEQGFWMQGHQWLRYWGKLPTVSKHYVPWRTAYEVNVLWVCISQSHWPILVHCPLQGLDTSIQHTTPNFWVSHKIRPAYSTHIKNITVFEHQVFEYVLL